jgi:L-ascorbate metabolism protein UlaG (beta-lactamase superfamily)
MPPPRAVEDDRIYSVLTLTWLGHSTVVIDVDAARLVTDPLLRPHAGVLRRRGQRPFAPAWAGADAVLLSHLHHDHAELSSLRSLGDVPVLTGPENAAWLQRRGLHGVGIEWDWVDVLSGFLQVRLVPAVHKHRPMPHRPNAAYGHLVRNARWCVWFAGDTSLYDDMAVIPGLVGRSHVDVAIVPVGGWGPRLSKGHMSPEDAAIACAMVRARWALPVHWGTLHPPLFDRFDLHWMDRPAQDFHLALTELAPDCRGIRLRPGGTITVPPRD